EGNFLGLDASGTPNQGNVVAGVSIQTSSNNLIGGAAPAARNVISANGSGFSSGFSGNFAGVSIKGSANTVQGNFIGTSVDGQKSFGNVVGVLVVDGPGNVIGGTTAGAGNVISANFAGVILAGTNDTGAM